MRGSKHSFRGSAVSVPFTYLYMCSYLAFASIACVFFICSCQHQLNAMKSETLQEAAKVAKQSALSSMVCICVCQVAFIVVYDWVVLFLWSWNILVVVCLHTPRCAGEIGRNKNGLLFVYGRACIEPMSILVKCSASRFEISVSRVVRPRTRSHCLAACVSSCLCVG